MEWLLAITGIVVGFGLKLLFDSLKAPKLAIQSVSAPFQMIEPLRVGTPRPSGGYNYLAYRVRVRNKRRRFFNVAAESCIAWLDLDSGQEPYQLSWVGELDSVTINVEDQREIDLCAINEVDRGIISPTERGYFHPFPRVIGYAGQTLNRKVRVTCRNGKRAVTNVSIQANSSMKLEIVLSAPEELRSKFSSMLRRWIIDK
ncbi:MAG: hypothetical protein HY671_01440 [Chloroflexi bacterium]|nr:hypothetical protein [Chloroflexota bacterium]